MPQFESAYCKKSELTNEYLYNLLLNRKYRSIFVVNKDYYDIYMKFVNKSGAKFLSKIKGKTKIIGCEDWHIDRRSNDMKAIRYWHRNRIGLNVPHRLVFISSDKAKAIQKQPGVFVLVVGGSYALDIYKKYYSVNV